MDGQADKRGSSFLDLEVEIDDGPGDGYTVVVGGPGVDELEGPFELPFSDVELENNLLTLQNALPGGRGRMVTSPNDLKIREFGKALFGSVFAADLRTSYEMSRGEAERQGLGLRIKLKVKAPKLASLPWEFLYDPRRDEYLCLSRYTPIVRYLEMPSWGRRELAIDPPLRILGMVSSPEGLPKLDVEREIAHVEEALSGLPKGVVEIKWLEGGSWQELQRELRRGTWHVFHFVGHGVFDRETDEGYLALCGRYGEKKLDIGITARRAAW